MLLRILISTPKDLEKKRRKNIFNKGKGFTLIELIVVIAVIGILAILVIVSLKLAINKAKYSKAKHEIREFVNMVIIAQSNTGQTLRQITGNGWSQGPCRNRDIRGIPDTDSCAVNWYNALSRIQTAGDITDTFIRLRRDGWNAPYCLDENELELGPADCRYDTIRTTGADGWLFTSDDYSVNIPHIICP